MKKKTKAKPVAVVEKRKKSTGSATNNEEKEATAGVMVRDNSEVSPGDVNVGISVDVTSIITQVDRNAPAPKPTVPVGPRRAPPKRMEKTEETSIFRRFMCCMSSSATNVTQPGQIGLTAPTSNHSHSALTQQDRPNSRPSTGNKGEGGSTRQKKLLALDLDETLVHSSFQPVPNASFVISVVIEGTVHNVYVMKRPGCNEFLKRLSQYYEIIIYTASLSKYADPLLDILDKELTISKRLFREHCVFYDGHYVKDLSLLNREITQTIIVDNSPMSYVFHPENAIDCSSFFDDPTDVELWQIADFLVSIRSCKDVRLMCRHWREWCRNNPSTVPANRDDEN